MTRADRIDALEQELQAKSLRLQGMQQLLEDQAAENEALKANREELRLYLVEVELERDKQAAKVEELERIVDQLTSESGALQRRVVRSGSKPAQAVDILNKMIEVSKENAEIRKANAEMVDRIRARDAEIERLRERLICPACGTQLGRVDGIGEFCPRPTCSTGWIERFDGQSDLPPTRAEEECTRLSASDVEWEAEANRIATEANEEREG